jgi:hypothetical protein
MTEQAAALTRHDLEAKIVTLLGRRGVPQGIYRRSGRRLRQVSPGSGGEHAEDRDPSGGAGILAHCLAGETATYR